MYLFIYRNAESARMTNLVSEEDKDAFKHDLLNDPDGPNVLEVEAHIELDEREEDILKGLSLIDSATDAERYCFLEVIEGLMQASFEHGVKFAK